jgi:hypothetical protein
MASGLIGAKDNSLIGAGGVHSVLPWGSMKHTRSSPGPLIMISIVVLPHSSSKYACTPNLRATFRLA